MSALMSGRVAEGFLSIRKDITFECLATACCSSIVSQSCRGIPVVLDVKWRMSTNLQGVSG